MKSGVENSSASLLATPEEAGCSAAGGTKYWQRFIAAAIRAAMSCRAGQPTANAILQQHWIKGEAPSALHLVSWGDACRLAGRDPEGARCRALRRITKAWKYAGRQEWQAQYEHNREAVLSCAGAQLPQRSQSVLALVPMADYEDVAMLDD